MDVLYLVMTLVEEEEAWFKNGGLSLEHRMNGM